MSLPVTDTSAPAADARHVGTLIIGSGFAGLGAAIKLAQAGITDYVVLERGNDVGGTWRDNSYPGAACDVPSHLYSYSFALNPEWTRSFSTQPEIYKYIQSVANRHKVLDKHIFDCDVLSARWDEASARWHVSTNKGEFVAKIVVSAVGALCEPSLPDIKGIDGFKGEIFHSSRWNHDADLTGKRVAVIGTGASAIQIVPAIGKKVSHLDVYQRTAPWILPRADREYTKIEHLAFKYLPGFQKLCRTGIYWMRETPFVVHAKAPVVLAPLSSAPATSPVHTPERKQRGGGEAGEDAQLLPAQHVHEEPAAGAGRHHAPVHRGDRRRRRDPSPVGGALGRGAADRLGLGADHSRLGPDRRNQLLSARRLQSPLGSTSE